MMNNNKRSGFFRGKGGYIALALCAALLVTAGVLARREPEQPPEDAQPMDASAPLMQEDVPVLASVPRATESAAPVTEPLQQTLKVTSPVEGKEIFGYSMETLSYNQTTRDWRTHNGVDIAAEAGTEVVAAADGEVYTTYEDPTLGYTVVIRHIGGYTTCYASLGEDLRVKAGDQVVLGQVIGTVAATALVETTLGPHVHFSVSYQDIPIDPADFLALG